MNAFTREVASFARGLEPDDLAKMLGFFHLAEKSGAPAIDLEIDASGQVALRIKMPSTARD